MQLELPPRGTYGVEIPAVVRPLFRAMSFTSGLVFKLGAKVQGQPLLRLTTVGARTGKKRRTVLAAFSEGDDAWLVVASNGGAARHPGWAFNLAHRPDRAKVEFAGRRAVVEAQLLEGSERESVWHHITEVSPGYKAYETKTDREIPIFRLTVTREAERS